MIGNQVTIVGSPAPTPRHSDSGGNHVAILLCTFNGARHLMAQLASIAGQTYADWTLWISDDGSTDVTLQVIDRFRAAYPHVRVRLVNGPRAGFAANYMSLVSHGEINADYLAFCDQDDIWLPGRLAASVKALNELDAGPALYCARTQYIDQNGRVVGESRPVPRECSFPRALAHNVCGGNTMLFNRQTRELMQRVPGVQVAAHDWLAYLLVTGAGGRVVYDPQTYVQYRQHPGNAMGENRSIPAKWHRLKRLAAGDLRTWTDANLQALDHVADALTPANQATLARFRAARSGAPWSRWWRLRTSGVQRDGRAANLAYRMAFAAGLV